MDGSKSTRIWHDLWEMNICNVRTKKKEAKSQNRIGTLGLGGVGGVGGEVESTTLVDSNVWLSGLQ